MNDNDNDIIKALEICANGGWCYRDGCPLAYKEYESEDEYERCVNDLLEHALGLVKRYRAEIERLQKYNTDVSRKHYNDGIKDFAEKLKKRLKLRTEYDEGGWSVDWYTVTEEDIDSLVKEMTEEQP